MVMMARDMEIREEAFEEGMVLFGTLIARLLSLGRNDDVQRAATDREYRARLLEEFQLT